MSNNSLQSRTVELDGYSFTVIPDRSEPYFLGESIGYTLRIKSLWHGTEGAIKEFNILILFPGGGTLVRPLGRQEFKENEDKTFRLDPPIYLGFLGFFSVTLPLGSTERLILAGLGTGQIIQYEAIITANSRDRLAFQLDNRLARLTWVLVALTILMLFAIIVQIVIAVR